MNWIKIKDRLPPKNEPFLGFGNDDLNEYGEIVVMIWWPGGKDDEGYHTIEGFYSLGKWGKYNREWYCRPTHWTPLPDFPKDEK